MTDTTAADAHGSREAAYDPVADLLIAWRAHRDATQLPLRGHRLTPRPYPGLRSFSPAETSVFFGRQGQEQPLAERLQVHNVLGVLGGSGSGKSSLVRAGLLPYLRSFGRIPDRCGRWYLAEMRPGTDATKASIEALWAQVIEPLAHRTFGAEALAAAFPDVPEAGAVPAQDLLPDHRRAFARLVTAGSGVLSPEGLLTFANETLQILDAKISAGLQAGPANLLLVIDQFEEVFRPEINEASRNAVIELIKEVHRRPRQGLFVVVTMRSEEMHRCAEYPGLSGIIFDTSVQIELISRDEDIEAAIVQPARRVLDLWGVPYERDGPAADTGPYDPDLVDRLRYEARRLRDHLDHKPDSLPLLQHALQSMWDKALERWEGERAMKNRDWVATITEDDFPFVTQPAPLQACLDSGAETSRERAIDLIAAKLRGPEEQRLEAAADLVDVAFTALARMDDANRWVRRFASARSIANASGLDLGTSKKVGLVEDAVAPFLRAGYLSVRDGQYDVSHEALIRSWDRYQNDILEDARLIRKALVDLDEMLSERQTASRGWGERSDATPVDDERPNRFFPPSAERSRLFARGRLLWRRLRSIGRRYLAPWIRPVVGVVRTAFDVVTAAGQKRAYEDLERGRQEALEKIFIPPRRFSERWAERQLIEHWRRVARQRAFLGTNLRGEGDARTREETQRARRRLDDFRRLLRRAMAWTDWRGMISSGRHRRVAAAILPLILISLGGLYVLEARNRESDARNRENAMRSIADMLGRVSHPNSNLLDVYDALLQASSLPKTASAAAQQPLDQLFYTLDTWGRERLRRIGVASSPEAFQSDPKPCHCLVASDKEGEALIGEKAGPIRGLRFFPQDPQSGFFLFMNDGNVNSPQARDRRADRKISQLLTFNEDSILCLSQDGGMLLQWSSRSFPVVFPLTWVLNKAAGDDAGSWIVRFRPGSVGAERQAGELPALVKMAESLAQEKASQALESRIAAFETPKARGFNIRNQNEQLQLAIVVGANEPQRVSEPDATFVDCLPSGARGGQTRDCSVEPLLSEGRTLILERVLAAADSSSTGGPCQDKGVPCQQELYLYATDYRGASRRTYRFTRADHFSHAIDGAVIHKGDLLLRDVSGAVWRYILETPQLLAAIEAIELPGATK